jgi:hypothetical protein
VVRQRREALTRRAIAIDLDLDSAFLGASRACIEDLLANSELEAAPLSLTAGIAADSDTPEPSPAPDSPNWVASYPSVGIARHRRGVL